MQNFIITYFQFAVFQKKLKISAKVKNLNHGWCECVYDLTEIEISPNNHNFIYYDNKYLLGKSQENSQTFDVLYFASLDIKEAVIPPQVKIIKENALSHRDNLKSVIFPENSELKTIEKYGIYNNKIQKIVLPESVEDCGVFSNLDNLTEIQVSSKNKLFSTFNGCLVKKSNIQNEVFDVLVFAPRNIEKIIIASCIKMIFNSAFFGCKKLKTIEFELNSSLEIIDEYGFASTALEKNCFSTISEGSA